MTGSVVCSDGRCVRQDVTVTKLVDNIWPEEVSGEYKKIVGARVEVTEPDKKQDC